MYTDFYGLKEEPFNITPDPRFLYWSLKHQEAFRHLVYSVQSNKGLAVLTGEPGTGKTAILHAVTEHLNKLYPDVHIAFLINSKISVHDLFRLIFDGFDIKIPADSNSKSMYLIQLRKFLVDQNIKNKKCILILDEAQNFHSSVLEEIRLLSNMETSVEKLLHIFLVGQPQLLRNIQAPSLAQLKQRLGIMYRLLPLNRQEMELYIHKRLSVAGAPEMDIFTADALDEIFVQAHGLPRLTNIMCDNALLLGCAANMPHLTRDIIQQVAQDMDVNSLEQSDIATDTLSGQITERGPSLGILSDPSPAEQHTGQISPFAKLQASTRDDTDRSVILQNIALAEGTYWDNLLSQSSSKNNALGHIWQEAAVRAARRRLKRFILLGVVSFGIVIALSGEHFGLWSLRTAVGHAWEIVTRQATLTYDNEKSTAGDVTTSTPHVLPQQRTIEGSESRTLSSASSNISVSPAPTLPKAPPSVTLPTRKIDREKVKKEVIIRSGDTLSKILTQEYGEYTPALVSLVIKANPGLGNIHRIEVGQRLILPEHPE